MHASTHLVKKLSLQSNQSPFIRASNNVVSGSKSSLVRLIKCNIDFARVETFPHSLPLMVYWMRDPDSWLLVHVVVLLPFTSGVECNAEKVISV